MVWARLGAIYFTCLVAEKFFCELEYVFDNSIKLSIIYDEFIGAH